MRQIYDKICDLQDDMELVLSMGNVSGYPEIPNALVYHIIQARLDLSYCQKAIESAGLQDFLNTVFYDPASVRLDEARHE